MKNPFPCASPGYPHFVRAQARTTAVALTILLLVVLAPPPTSAFGGPGALLSKERMLLVKGQPVSSLACTKIPRMTPSSRKRFSRAST